MIPVSRQDKWRVLFVPDSLYWVPATIARQICRYNPWIEPTLCSSSALAQVLDLYSGSYPGKIDLVHFLTKDIAIEFMPAFRHTTPCVMTNHHIEQNTSTAPHHDADAVMTVCHQWHSELVAQGVPAGKCVMVPNGVDVELFKPPSPGQREQARTKLGFEKDRIYVGFCGKRSSNTSNRKGIETLVQAIQSLKRTREIGLAILGFGWNDVVRELRQQGIACVHIPFLLDRKDVADFYTAIDVFWVTSRIEGGPVPLLEAMSSGVACLSTPVGVAREAIEPGVNGIVAPFDAPEFYAKTTADLLDSPDQKQRLGRAARETIVQRFQSSQTTLSVAKLYEVAAHQFKLRGGQAERSLTFNPMNLLDGETADEKPMLASLPREIHARVTAAEHLAYMHHLRNEGATRAAIGVGWRAVRASPAYVLRTFLSSSPTIRSCYTSCKKFAALPWAHR